MFTPQINDIPRSSILTAPFQYYFTQSLTK